MYALNTKEDLSMKGILIVAVIIWGLFHFSQPLFGFNAGKMLESDGVIGVTKQVLCGKGDCK